MERLGIGSVRAQRAVEKLARRNRDAALELLATRGAVERDGLVGVLRLGAAPDQHQACLCRYIDVPTP